MNGQCLLCPAPASQPAVFAVEPDDGAEALSCEAHLGALVTAMFSNGSVAAPAWGLTVYDVRPSP